MSVLVDDIVVSPVEAIPDGVEASLSEMGLSIKGANFGDSVKKGTLVKTSVGVVMVDREPETRTVVLKLMVREGSGVALAEAAHNLEVIVGELQERDNWIRRDFHRTGAGFEPVLYHVSGEVTLSDFLTWQVGESPDVTLTLVCDFAAYSTEEVESEEFKSVEGDRHLIYELPPSGGTTKGLKRVRVTNEGEEDWRGLIWSEECETYKPEDLTALPHYKAADLTPKGGAEVKTVEGTELVQHTALTAGKLAILGSEIDGVGHMTHRGPRKVWMRVEQPSGSVGDVKMQMLSRPLGSSRWDEGGPIVSPYVVGDECLMQFGVHRPQAAVLGDERWEWALLVWAPGGSGGIRIVDVYPLSTEQYLECSEPYEAPLADLYSTRSPGTTESNASEGDVAWSNHSDAKASDGKYATATVEAAGKSSEFLLVKNFGFSIPEGATVLGIVPGVKHKASASGPLAGVSSHSAQIVKGGSIGAYNAISTTSLWGASDETEFFGGSSDLWSESWTPADINAEGFGFAFRCFLGALSAVTAYVDAITITVYYTEVEAGNVCNATRSIELATDGIVREHRTDDVWGRVVPDGFLPIDQPGGPSRGILIPTRGDLGELPDSGITPLSAVLRGREGHLYAGGESS